MPGPGVATVGGLADGDGLPAVLAHRLFVAHQPGHLAAGDVEVGEDEAIRAVLGPPLGFVQVASSLGEVEEQGGRAALSMREPALFHIRLIVDPYVIGSGVATRWSTSQVKSEIGNVRSL